MRHLLTRESVTIAGEAGRLRGEFLYGDEPTHAALLLNPHPYMGGTMRNRLVEAVAERLADAGAAVLRFDYRGVGESGGAPVDVAAAMSAFWTSGHAPFDPELVADADAALDWTRTSAGLPVSLVGYSFGAWVVSRIIDAATPSAALIAPTIKTHDLSAVWPVGCRTQVVYSDNDFATPLATSEAWIDAVAPDAERMRVVGADHFFRGVERTIGDRIAAFITGREAFGDTPCP